MKWITVEFSSKCVEKELEERDQRQGDLLENPGPGHR